MRNCRLVGRLGGCVVILALMAGCATVGSNFAWVKGDTPLARAAASGNTAQVTALLAQGANVNTRDKTGHTPLFSAVVNGHREVTALLIAHGAEVNARDNKGGTPLFGAALKGHVQVVEALIAHGADVNATTIRRGITPLVAAVVGGSQTVTTLLLAHGADVNARATIKNRIGVTPLFLAMAKGDKGIVEALITHGADVNARATSGDIVGVTPLFGAIFKGNKGIVEALITHGADVNARITIKNDAGITPLWYAVSTGHIGVAKVLLAHGADVNAKDSNGQTLLQAADQISDPNKKEAMIALLQDPVATIQAMQAAQAAQWQQDNHSLATQAQKAQATGHMTQAFADYVHLLQTFPADTPVGAGHVGTGRYYAHILRQLLATARHLRTLPPLPPAYRREMVVGLADVQSAKTAADYALAQSHFLKAARLAPWNPLPYDALGHILESQKHYREAADYFRLYLLLRPNAPDAQALQDRIYVLEDHGR